MKRILVMLCAVAVLVACAVPALAADFEPRDYVTTEYVGEDLTTLEVSIPASAFTGIYWIAYDGDDTTTWQTPYAETVGTVFDFTLGEYYHTWVDCSPFASADYIDISDFVDGTEVYVHYDLTYVSEWGVQNEVENRFQIYYFDYKYNRISVDFTTWEFTGNEFGENGASFYLDIPDGAKYMTFILQFGNVYSDMDGMENQLTLQLNSVDFICDVETLKTQEQLTGETNRLLEKLMDGYQPTPIKPDGADKFDGLNDDEMQVLDEVTSGNVAAEEVFLTAIDKIMLYAAGFGVFSTIFTMFAGLEFVDVLLTVSLALGMFALLLGGVQSVLGRYK